jgi:flagellar protein FlaH
MLGVSVVKNPSATGRKDIADALGGNINEHSLAIIEGESQTGKSVLCQYLGYNAISTKRKAVVYYTLEHTADSLSVQMKSMGMNIEYSINGYRFFIQEMIPAMDLKSSVFCLSAILKSIARLPAWYKYIILDTPSSYLLRLNSNTQMKFLMQLKKLCVNSRSIITVLDTEIMDQPTLSRARELSDYYLKLTNENKVLEKGQVSHHDAKLLQVTKLNGVEQAMARCVRFEIVPETGIQILPFYHIKI